ncbi:MAG TPA: glycoside hydrolase family 27 protein [Verrucomicrobiae bacterium]|nr:glycoside hydrolase family 27 protein [Verrucomicrobiae bacterium]
MNLPRSAFFLTLVILLPGPCLAGEPDLARTPPMGWNSWNCFRLDISDEIIRAEAAVMVKSGMRDAGYQYIVIDGGWEGYHDTNGVFHSDAKRFPDMKALCDYIHSLGLKVGIHTSPGPTTCTGHEASYGHEKQDAATFAGWGIDFVKYDWCSADKVYQPAQMQDAYRKMSDDLKATGRPIVYSLCQYGIQDVWKWGGSVGGQMWRTSNDIADNYDSMILHGLMENGLEKYAGPGHWNDPDMLEIGNGKMGPDEWRTQMTLWCVLAAPLFAGNDLTQMKPKVLEVLTNPEAIAIDQDPAGIQGHCARQEGPTQIWTKSLADGGTAVALFNLNAHPMTIRADFKEIGLPKRVSARDLWLHKDLGTFKRSFSFVVPRHGSVLLNVTAR